MIKITDLLKTVNEVDLSCIPDGFGIKAKDNVWHRNGHRCLPFYINDSHFYHLPLYHMPNMVSELEFEFLIRFGH